MMTALPGTTPPSGIATWMTSTIQTIKEDAMNPADYNSLPALLTVEEVASLLRVGRNATYSLVKSGGIYSIRIGHSIRIPRNALLQLLEPAQ
ncbi:MAG: helix-turn-helix domain-containing protein [Oscillospiraceae bacterium]|nr:helix-turn-helix domain-containing protein [Oscillospiraceae bacterium]